MRIASITPCKMKPGTAFALAASQPIVSGVRDFCIAADLSARAYAIKQKLKVHIRGGSTVADPWRHSLAGNFLTRNRASRFRGDRFVLRRTSVHYQQKGRKQDTVESKPFHCCPTYS